eukprot:scaffold606_cov375-Pinguiococcus_pyrenoidosus.AAC.1
MVAARWSASPPSDLDSASALLRTLRFRNTETVIAYASYVAFFVCGFVVIVFLVDEDSDGGIEAAEQDLLSILSEVFLLHSIATLLALPVIDTDETQGLLTEEENEQKERSGVLTAPWVPAVVEILGEDYEADLEFFYPADFRPANSRKATNQVSDDDELLTAKERASQLLAGCAPGWMSPWYVAAVGRCDLRSLSSETLQMLSTFLTGASPSTDRYTTAAAVLSCGSLYASTGARTVSHRLLVMWEAHEISAIRADCVLAIKAIGYEPLVRFVEVAERITTFDSLSPIEEFYKARALDTSTLQAKSLRALYRALSGPSHTRLMCMAVACHMFRPGQEPPTRDELTEYIVAVDQYVLSMPFEKHFVSELALESLARSAKLLKLDEVAEKDREPWKSTGSLDELFANERLLLNMWSIGIELNTTSVYKQVRAQAQRLLQVTAYPYQSTFSLFGAKATKTFADAGLSPRAARLVMEENLPDGLLQQIHERAQALTNPEEELEDLFQITRSGAKGGAEEARRLSRVNSESDWSSITDPLAFEDLVSLEPAEQPEFLLYALIANWGRRGFSSWQMSDIFIQRRLNSSDRLERYVGLLCIGAFLERSVSEKLRRVVLPGVVANELVSDVRELATLILETGYTWACCKGRGRQLAEEDPQLRLLRQERSRLEDMVAERKGRGEVKDNAGSNSHRLVEKQTTIRREATLTRKT